MWKRSLRLLGLMQSRCCWGGVTRQGPGNLHRPGTTTAKSPAAQRTSPLGNQLEVAPSGTPTSSAAAPGASSFSPPTTEAVQTSASPSMSHALDQLRELSRRHQHKLREQDEAILQLKQQLTLAERRAVQLEVSTNSLHAQLNGVHRLVGEVVMGQRNTDILVQQVERRQLTLGTTHIQQKEGPTSRRGEAGGEGGPSPVRASVSPALSASPENKGANGTATASMPQAKGIVVGPTVVGATATSSSVSALAEQVAVLKARLDQLAAALFATDRIRTVAEERVMSSETGTHHIAEAIAALSNEPRSSRSAILGQLLRRHALDTFVDTSGTMRVTSQCICVHNIPLNMGAAEVRELCVQHVCQGRATELVSCMVRLDRPRQATSAYSSSPAAAATRVDAAEVDVSHQDTFSSSLGTPRASPQYRSHSSSSVLPGKAGVAAAPQDAAVGTSSVVGALPRGNSVAAPYPHTKSFEVVFTSSAVAVRALQVLNGLRLRPTAPGAPLPLAAEPVVSADVLAALQTLEEEGGARENKLCAAVPMARTALQDGMKEGGKGS